MGDEALLDYIEDTEIAEAFRAVPKYYVQEGENVKS